MKRSTSFVLCYCSFFSLSLFLSFYLSHIGAGWYFILDDYLFGDQIYLLYFFANRCLLQSALMPVVVHFFFVIWILIDPRCKYFSNHRLEFSIFRRFSISSNIQLNVYFFPHILHSFLCWFGSIFLERYYPFYLSSSLNSHACTRQPHSCFMSYVYIFSCVTVSYGQAILISILLNKKKSLPIFLVYYKIFQ